MMQEYMQIVRELLSDQDAVTIGYHRIESFHKLVLDELPYGPLDPTALVQGQVEFDGPATHPPNTRRPLQWYFGGTPWEICKAVRLQYQYQRSIPGLEYPAPVNGSLFLGYVSNPLDPPPYYLDAYKSERDTVAKGPPMDVATLLDAFRGVYVTSPSRTTPDAMYVPTSMFDEFVLENFPWQKPGDIAGLRKAAQDAAASDCCDAPQPTPLSQMLDRGPANHLPGARIEFDGPARTNDRSNIFPYTVHTLFNEQSSLYGKLLWWYFGGRAYQITKAMHLQYDDSPIHTGDQPHALSAPPQERRDNGFHRGSLLVGYQGPGGYP